jgi:hypothetical protein
MSMDRRDVTPECTEGKENESRQEERRAGRRRDNSTKKRTGITRMKVRQTQPAQWV